MVEKVLKIKMIIFTPIVIFIFSGCMAEMAGLALADPPKPVYLSYGSLFGKPDLCEIAEDEENILSTQTIDLAAIKANQADREAGNQLFLACLAKSKQWKITVEYGDSGDKANLVTWNVYGHANGYQTDDSRIIKSLARKNCKRLLKKLIKIKGYAVPSGLLVCRATCDMCRY
jgi:hypothetical protein